MKYNKEKVNKILPQKWPFNFIDECINVTLPTEIKVPHDIIGSSSECTYVVNKDNPIFKGHFPQKAILPGVIHAEIMAQSSFFIFYTLGELYKKELSNSNLKGREGVLLSLDNIKFKKPIFPEMKLNIKTTVEKIFQNIAIIKGEIYHNEKIVSKGRFKIAIISLNEEYK